MTTDKTPAAWASDGSAYDCTGHIGSLGSGRPWEMYSFDRGGYMVWNAVATELHKRGWPDVRIQAWLQSKEARWALDGVLGDAITEAASKYAAEHIPTGWRL